MRAGAANPCAMVSSANILTDIPVCFETEELLLRLRVDRDSPDAQQLRDLVDRVRSVARPKAACGQWYVGAKGTETVEIGRVTFTSRVLRVNLEHAHRVFPYLATCGREIDALGETLDDPLQRYWLDELKMVALGAASARVRQHIEQTYRPGKTSAISPGSLRDWPITQQRPLFSLFGDAAARIGVTLTDSFLMVPTKSVSGIVFPTEVSFESCRLCPRSDCPGRRAEYDPNLWEQRYAEKPARCG